MSTDEQQNRGGFVPIGELADTLPGVIPRGRAMSAQARHHFTTLRQVNQLIEASEAEPDLGFMARLLALCFVAAHEPRRPASIQARQRSIQVDHDRNERREAALRHPAASAAGVGLLRGGSDAAP